MNKLTPMQLVLINQKILADKNSIPTKEKLDLIEEISNIPYEKNEELFYKYRGTVEKAAKLGQLIAQRKPFEKANQETAVLALLTLLEINGCRIINYKNDIDELCSCLEGTEIDSIYTWINLHMEDRDIASVK